MNTLSLIQKELSVDNVSGHIRWMCENTPYRIAGSEDEAKAARYVADCLEAYGLEARIDRFYAYNSIPLSSRLEVLSPEREMIACLPCAHIRSTASEGETFDLIYVGSGGYDDYARVDPTGKVVLVEVSYSPPVPEKARIAYKLGAAGIVCMNWGNDEPVICNRGLKSVWGNPTEETIDNIPHLVGVSVRRADGLRLKALCEAHGAVKIRLSAQADAAWGPVHQPVGILRGNGKTDEFIVVGAHLDAWQPGVTCNATGNGTALELARVLAQHREALNRDIWFVFWTGHEIAEAAGSTWFVDQYWDALNRNAVAYLNIDSTGLRDAELYEAKVSDELYDFIHTAARGALPPEMDIKMCALPKIGDQSFFGLGLPAAASRMNYTDAYIQKNNGVTLGWWNHTDQDGYDKYSPENNRYDLAALSAMLYQLASNEVIPYNYGRKLGNIHDELEKLAETDGGLDIAGLLARLETLEAAVAAIEWERPNLREEAQVRQYNAFAIGLNRLLTNVFHTYTNKYQQDSYGYTRLATPVPLLADMAHLTQYSEDSMEYGMMLTQLRKNRNRISDALDQAFERARLYCRLMGITF